MSRTTRDLLQDLVTFLPQALGHVEKVDADLAKKLEPLLVEAKGVISQPLPDVLAAVDAAPRIR